MVDYDRLIIALVFAGLAWLWGMTAEYRRRRNG